MDRNRTRTCYDDRGQSYTLESIAAGLVVLAAVIFALQATAVTPLSVSTASQHVENQEREMADTLMDQAAVNGTLQSAVLFWNSEDRTFVNATAEGYLGRTPDNEFGDQLERVFSSSQIAVNVYVGYGKRRGSLGRETMIYQGTPSDNAVSSTHTLVLMDEDHLRGPFSNQTLNGTDNATARTDGFAFYAPDIAPNGSVYNVLEVRIVAWQM